MDSKKWVIFTLLLLCYQSPISTYIYTSSLVSIAHDLNASIDDAQWTMAVFVIAGVCFQLVYGIVSESVGRKGPLIAALTLATLGAIIGFFAKNIDELLIARFIQGCGTMAGTGLWRVILRDLYYGKTLAIYSSYIMMFNVSITFGAIMLGAFFQHAYGWRASFLFMVCYSVILLTLVIFRLRETYPEASKEKMKIRHIKKSFRELFSSPFFIGIVICGLSSYGIFFAWFGLGPVLIIDVLGKKPLYFAWINFVFGGLIYLGMSLLNRILIRYTKLLSLTSIGLTLMILSTLTMIVGHLLFPINIWVLMIPMTLFFASLGFIWPNLITLALTPFGKNIGYAGTFYAFMLNCGASISGSLIAYLPNVNQLPIAVIMIIASSLFFIVYKTMVVRDFQPD